MIREPMIVPSRSISWPFAFAGNIACASPVTASGYATPRRSVVTMVINTAMVRFLVIFMVYASPIMVMTTSIVLMPTNGTTIPPAP